MKDTGILSYPRYHAPLGYVRLCVLTTHLADLAAQCRGQVMWIPRVDYRSSSAQPQPSSETANTRM
jgi:hypothetical protein